MPLLDFNCVALYSNNDFAYDGDGDSDGDGDYDGMGIAIDRSIDK